MKPSRAAASMLILAAVAIAAPHASSAQTPLPFPQTAAIDRILVMPFENPTGEGRLHWLREGAAVLLGDDLRVCGATPIGRDERIKAFERLGVPASATLSEATVIKLGQLLGASSVVIGSVALQGDSLNVRARTIRLDSGRMQGEVSEQSPLPDLVRMFDRLVVRLFPVLVLPPTHTDKDYAPLPAFENYIKGLVAKTPAEQVRFFQAALEHYPEYEVVRLGLWQVYTAQGDHAKALSAALEVSEKSPAYRRARFLAALSQLELKQYDQAFNTLRLLNDQKRAATVLNNMGVVQLRRGSVGPTGVPTSSFREAREVDPGDFDYSFNLGYASWVERDLPAAVYWLREAVRGNPADGDAHYVLGTALVATGADAEGAREKDLARRLSSRYAEWDRRPPGDPIPRGLERLKEDLDPAPLARGDLAFQAAEQKDQQQLARFHLEQGRRSFEHESDRDAIAELQRAIYLSPYDAEAHLLLGRVYLRNGRQRDAVAELKISLWSQETVAAHVALGEAYLQGKDVQSARGEAQRALALDPQSAEAKKLLERIGQ
jgi:tetratricopeptide (TPR) repeat protein